MPSQAAQARAPSIRGDRSPPGAAVQRAGQAGAVAGPQEERLTQLAAQLDSRPAMRALSAMAAGLSAPVQRQPNKTGLPDALKQGMEGESGMALDTVRVHYNSARPADFGAHAITQGHEIHVGAGQERHLPHELGHVVQQMQGRVRPTVQMNDTPVNDDSGLEAEADRLGDSAASAGTVIDRGMPPMQRRWSGSDIVQRSRGQHKLRKTGNKKAVKRTPFKQKTLITVKLTKGQHRRHVIPSHLFVDLLNNCEKSWTMAQINTLKTKFNVADFQALYELMNNNVNNLVPGAGPANSAIGMVAHRGQKALRNKGNWSDQDMNDADKSLFDYQGFQQDEQRKLFSPISKISKKIRKKDRGDWLQDVAYNADFDWPAGMGYKTYSAWHGVYTRMLEASHNAATTTPQAVGKIIQDYFALKL